MPQVSREEAIEKYLGLLRLMGVGKWELSAYLTLVLQGPLNASELASKSSVPYSRIYSVLRKLEDEGWITVDRKKRPSIFKARPPIEVWQRISAKVNELMNLEELMSSLQEAYELSHKGAPIKEPVALLHGVGMIRRLCVNLVNNASSIVYVACPFEEMLDDELVTSLNKAAYRLTGDKVKFLTDLKMKNYVMSRLRGVRIRCRDKLFGFGALSEKEVVLAVRYTAGVLGMYSTSPYFTDIAKVYFEYLWKDSLTLPSTVS